jgi:hypothetical protein
MLPMLFPLLVALPMLFVGASFRCGTLFFIVIEFSTLPLGILAAPSTEKAPDTTPIDPETNKSPLSPCEHPV